MTVDVPTIWSQAWIGWRMIWVKYAGQSLIQNFMVCFGNHCFFLSNFPPVCFCLNLWQYISFRCFFKKHMGTASTWIKPTYIIPQHPQPGGWSLGSPGVPSCSPHVSSIFIPKKQPPWTPRWNVVGGRGHCHVVAAGPGGSSGWGATSADHILRGATAGDAAKHGGPDRALWLCPKLGLGLHHQLPQGWIHGRCKRGHMLSKAMS